MTCQHDNSTLNFKKTSGDDYSKSLFKIIIKNCIAQWQFKMTVQNESSQLHLKIAFQNYNSKLHLKKKVQNANSKSEFKITSQKNNKHYSSTWQFEMTLRNDNSKSL